MLRTCSSTPPIYGGYLWHTWAIFINYSIPFCSRVEMPENRAGEKQLCPSAFLEGINVV
jgi:hypothetical protein